MKTADKFSALYEKEKLVNQLLNNAILSLVAERDKMDSENISSNTERILELEERQRKAFDLLEECMTTVSTIGMTKKVSIAMTLLTDDEQ